MAPEHITKEIEKIIRNFLRDESNDVKKCYWVGWKNVSKPVKTGGLGIKNLRVMNTSPLQK